MVRKTRSQHHTYLNQVEKLNASVVLLDIARLLLSHVHQSEWRDVLFGKAIVIACYLQERPFTTACYSSK